MLGIVTICAYGSWYYAFGVLLDPIRLDTGWGESALALSFSVGIVVLGLGSVLGGSLLDRLGHRWVFGFGGLIGAGGLLTASLATNLVVFFIGAIAGLGALGSLGFYHVTMATAVRLHPGNPSRAIAVLTLWGALASAIYLPLTAWLVASIAWRDTVRVFALIALVTFWMAAVMLPSPVGGTEAKHRPLRVLLAKTVADPRPRLFTLAIALGGVAMATLLVYQVPVMTAIGLPTGTAASIAGLRGFSQLGGRAPLAPLLRWFGSDRTLLLAFGAIACGGALLAFSSALPVAVVFAIVAGFGIGAFSPLQGIKAEELFGRDGLGATMGIYGAVLTVAGSVGPAMAGVLAERTGERRWVAGIIVVAALGAGAAVLAMARLDEHDEELMNSQETHRPA